MLMLLCAVTAWAQVTSGAVYSIQNKAHGTAISQDTKNELAMKAVDTNDNSQLWIVEGENGVYTMRNLASGACAMYVDGLYTHWYTQYVATPFYIGEYSAANGETPAYYYISLREIANVAEDQNATMHSSNGYVVRWNQSADASQWNFVEVENVDIATISAGWVNMTQAKSAAVAKLQSLSSLSLIYPSAEEYIANVNEVAATGTTIEALKVANDEIESIVNSYVGFAENSFDGKYFRFQNTNTTDANRSNVYLAIDYSDSKGRGIKEFNFATATWKLVPSNGSFYLYNEHSGLYLGKPSGEGALTASPVDAFSFEVVDETNGIVEIKSGSETIHIHNWSDCTITNYDGNESASRWYLQAVSIDEMIADYKASATEFMSSLGSVFSDAEKSSVSSASASSFKEVKAVVDNVIAAKMFTFRNTDTAVAARVDAYLSANASTGKGCGSKVFDYNAVWSLHYVGANLFYLYNELNEVYLGLPSGEGALTAAVSAAAFSFEFIEANKAELKCGNQTLHLGGNLALMNYDQNDPASRWIIEFIDIAAEIQTILDGLTETDYAVVPALGQYTTAAYEALVAARTNAKTVEEVSAAITAFKKAKNVPVYFIRSAHEGYAAGSAMYYDGAAWKWKAANKYDKQMWMTMPAYTQENVPTVETYSADNASYAICDYLTGTAIRNEGNIQIVAIEGWNNAYNLMYGADAAHHAASSEQSVVWWHAATTTNNQASAWYVDYVGNTYDLDQLTDAQLAAATELQAACAASKNVALGTDVGLYTDATGNFADAQAAALEILNKNLGELDAVEAINAAKTAIASATAALSINAPATGKYYRLKNVASGKYMSDNNGTAGVGGEGAATIFYLGENNTLLSYTKGQYLDCGAKNFATVGESKNGAFGVAYDGATANVITYMNNGYWTFGNRQEDNNLDRGSSTPNQAGYNWTIEEVTELPVSITAAGYATFFAPVAVELEDGVTAHTVTVDGEAAVLSEPMTVVPANTGVVLAGEEGAYNFTITTAAAFEGENLMNGTVAKTVVEKVAGKEYYVLANVEDAVGMYVATNGEEATNVFTNGSHKAFLAVEGANGIKSFSFRIPGTTGIENVVVENGVNVIFDLTGRKVESISAPGIYIVNGKKVLVK